MAYTITTTAGAQLATVADGTVNNSATSLTLIGKNYAGYGIFLNENYIKLLENFSNSTAPSGALTGQLWYDTANSVLKVYDGSGWKPISSSASGSTQPVNPIIGDLWWDIANAQLKVYTGSAWLTVGPAYTSTSGTSGAVVENIQDSSTVSHVAVKFYIQNSVIAILSKDSVYTPGTAISGFTTIKPGLNLISSSALANSQFTGDASNALSLGGVSAAQFLRSDQNATTSYKITAGGGVTVGSDLELTSGANAVVLNNTTNNKDFDFYVNRGGSPIKAIGIAGLTAAVSFSNAVTVSGTLTSTGATTHSSTTLLQGQTTLGAALVPNANNTISLGTSGTKFANVWATTFRGTAIEAQYADLAERFEADVPMQPGTVVALGGTKEITAAAQELGEDVFGVISTAAGFLMNGGAGNNLTHPPIAVNGRVPVRVIGPINKGDRLVSAGNGLARAAKRSEITAFNVIGRALENKTTQNEGTVEAIVKLNS
jgi:hypothetical protein